MKNGYALLNTLTNNLNNSSSIIISIANSNKEEFANSDELINLGIGLLSEVNNILNSLDDEVYILSSKLYNIVYPIKEYASNMFNSYKFVNAYKLHDCITIDICKLRNYLNSLK